MVIPRELRWPLGGLLVLLAALILQSGLLAYATYVLLGVLLVSRLLARDWVGRLTAVRECEPGPFEVGDRVRVRVHLHNTGRLPVPWALMEDMLPRSALKQRPPRLTLKGNRLQVGLLPGGGEVTLKYRLTFETRGYYQIGPVLVESGDLFGLHRRHRVLTAPVFVLVYPKVVALPSFDFASRRPIGDVQLTHRLYEDPTRHAGVRPYQLGDPLQRIHWRATARTGELHSKVYDPTTLAGATLLLDFHESGYPARGEPYRSELAVTAAASLAHAVAVLGEQIGLASNGRDAADRLRREAAATRSASNQSDAGRVVRSRRQARAELEMHEQNDRLQPPIVPTRRGPEQFERIRELLARVELTDGSTFAALVLEVTPRLPRDATVLAVLPAVPVETAVALGGLRRQGFAVSALLIGLGEDDLPIAHGRLVAEGIRDVRHLADEAGLALLCNEPIHRGGGYAYADD